MACGPVCHTRGGSSSAPGGGDHSKGAPFECPPIGAPGGGGVNGGGGVDAWTVELKLNICFWGGR